MFLTKNQLIDKTDMLRVMFQNFYGDSFLFSPTDKAWKEKRKATAHAFYKERTALMLNVLKDKVAALCQKWTTQIQQSEVVNEVGQREAVVDIA